MRISDWSSDVCSSDLWDIAGNSVRESGSLWPQVDGHQTNHANKDWWMTDTYPDRYSFQHLYALEESGSGERILLGRFRAPLGMGPNKCDLRPRRSAEIGRASGRDRVCN